MSGTVLFKVQNARRLPLQAGCPFIPIWQERLSGTLIKLPHLGLPWASKACISKLFEPTLTLPSSGDFLSFLLWPHPDVLGTTLATSHLDLSQQPRQTSIHHSF